MFKSRVLLEQHICTCDNCLTSNLNNGVNVTMIKKEKRFPDDNKFTGSNDFKTEVKHHTIQETFKNGTSGSKSRSP